MRVEEARERVERIRAMAGDDESAHGEEDQFRHEVLLEIAHGTHCARELASIALTTSDIDFSRWFA